MAPENRQLLREKHNRIQAALDEWHRSNPGQLIKRPINLPRERWR
ncbi:hypothetical protein ACLK14_16715 [Escherichia coli]